MSPSFAQPLAEPVRTTSLGILQQLCFSTDIIGSVGGDGVRALELGWHRLWWLTPSCRLQTARRMDSQPVNVLLAAVLLFFAEPVLILLAEIRAEHTQPHIMIKALAHPDRTWVILVLNRLIATLRQALPKRRRREIWNTETPMRRVKKLCRFQNHLHNMLITMPTRTARWFVRKVEYIHRGVGRRMRVDCFNFSGKLLIFCKKLLFLIIASHSWIV